MKADWRKSSYSGNSTDEMCVEVAGLVGGVGIRDSKDPGGGRLTVGVDQFGVLLQRIKAGALDRP
ncbi:DUF397 domain-containing protein [Actinomadura violacea]|uniref:DUF397 domain-containing protein n=1 Tax=Actinomadura violacea TaxID=2819934 RepID=A0ABS3S5N8_9ACTN|nr:DUF397 domain-containing protein [Actinomadura violacea]MBO2464329.1 DUF397 domain-containing protein [Actinomadura violacea]